MPRASTYSFKRLSWVILLGLALALSGNRLALTQPKADRLRFAHTFTTASERAILEDAIAEFEAKHPPIKIEQTVSNSEVYNTIGWRLQFQGRKQPDIYFQWDGFKVQYSIERGWALDMTPYLTPGFEDQFVSAAVKRYKNGVYFLPHSADISNLVWYNREIFKKLGLAEPNSLDEWIEVCNRLRSANVLPLAQGNRDLWPMGNFGAELLGQTIGPEAVDPLFQPGRPISADELSGLKTMIVLRQKGGFDLPGLFEPGAIGLFGDIDAKVFFLGGKSAQHIIGSWFLADIADAKNKNELKFSAGVFPVPPAQGEVDAITSVTTGFLVNASACNPQAAVAFVELLLSRKYQSRFAALGNLSMRHDAPQFTTDPLARRMLEILSGAPAIVPPPDTGYRPEQATVFYEMCGKILTGKLDIAQAARYWTKEKENLSRKGL